MPLDCMHTVLPSTMTANNHITNFAYGAGNMQNSSSSSSSSSCNADTLQITGKMFLRPAVLSRGHVALVVSPVLSYPSGSNKAITAAATMETEIMISTMGSVHDHWMTCKSRVDEMMRQFEDFDFSICSPQENLWFGKHLTASTYCELVIALYQDNSPSTALLVEVDYIKGDKEKFYRFLKAFRSYLLGSSYDDVMLDIYLQKRKFIPFLSTESFYKEYVHGMLSIIQHNKRMDLKLYGLKQLMLALTTCKQYLLGSMLAEEVIIVTEALLTITGKESYLHELTIVSMCVMLEQRELRLLLTKQIGCFHWVIDYLLDLNRHHKNYFAIVQTVRNCCAILWTMLKLNRILTKTLMQPMAMPDSDSNIVIFECILHNHYHMDVRVDQWLEKIQQVLEKPEDSHPQPPPQDGKEQRAMMDTSATAEEKTGAVKKAASPSAPPMQVSRTTSAGSRTRAGTRTGNDSSKTNSTSLAAVGSDENKTATSSTAESASKQEELKAPSVPSSPTSPVATPTLMPIDVTTSAVVVPPPSATIYQSTVPWTMMTLPKDILTMKVSPYLTPVENNRFFASCKAWLPWLRQIRIKTLDQSQVLRFETDQHFREQIIAHISQQHGHKKQPTLVIQANDLPFHTFALLAEYALFIKSIHCHAIWKFERSFITRHKHPELYPLLQNKTTGVTLVMTLSELMLLHQLRVNEFNEPINLEWIEYLQKQQAAQGGAALALPDAAGGSTGVHRSIATLRHIKQITVGFNNKCELELSQSHTALESINILFCEDLSSLQCLEHVKTVCIRNCRQITDFTSLQHAQDVHISDMTLLNNHLMALQHVNKIHLQNVEVKDLRCLAHIHILHLHTCNVTSYPKPTGVGQQEWSFTSVNIVDVRGYEKLYKLVLSSCDRIKDIRNLGSIQYLKIHDCKQIVQFPKPIGTKQEWYFYKVAISDLTGFHVLYRVTFGGCNHIKNTNALRGVAKVHIGYCTASIDISGLTNAEEIIIQCCKGIRDVSKLGHVNELTLKQCPDVRNVSALGNVHTLVLDECHNVKDVSALATVKILTILDCHGVKDVSMLHKVEELTLRGCVNVKSIKGLKNLYGKAIPQHFMTADMKAYYYSEGKDEQAQQQLQKQAQLQAQQQSLFQANQPFNSKR